MSELQSPEKSLNIIKDEIFGALRKIETNMKLKFVDFESKLKNILEEYNLKLDSISSDNKELKEIIFPQKLKIEKITDLENFKNKVNDMLITHEVRIKNNFDTLTKFQLRIDKLISENLYVPGFIGSACQFKTLSDYLSYNINEVAKIKLDREQVRKDFKDLKIRQENMMKSMVTLNESTVHICNTYADGKNNDIKRILNQNIEQLNQKSFEMRTKVHQFEENAKKLEEKFKIELENIIEIKNNITNEMKNNSMDIKKINEEMTKRIKDNTYDITIVKKKIENITEQIKEVNKSINNMKMRNLNASTIMNNRSKLNISNSLSPYKEKRIKPTLDLKTTSPHKREEKHLTTIRRNINKSDISLDSIITENSILNDNSTRKTKDMKIDTNNNELKEIKSILKENKENKEIKENKENKDDNTINTINTINSINKKIKPKMNNDSTNTNLNNMKIQSIESIKNKIKENIKENINRYKGEPLPTIIKKKGRNDINLLSEETRKSIETIKNINVSQRTKTIVQNNSNDILKIKKTKIVFHLDNNLPDSFDEYNPNPNFFGKRKKSIDKNILKTNNNNNNKNANKKVKFTQKKEMAQKRVSDVLTSKEKEKDKEKQGIKIISLSLPIEEENKINKNTKEELSSIMDNYRVNAFTNIKNVNENNIDISNNEEMLDFPRKINPFGRTTYNFFTKNDIINHINANKNINNFDNVNNKNKK